MTTLLTNELTGRLPNASRRLYSREILGLLQRNGQSHAQGYRESEK